MGLTHRALTLATNTRSAVGTQRVIELRARVSRVFTHVSVVLVIASETTRSVTIFGHDQQRGDGYTRFWIQINQTDLANVALQQRFCCRVTYEHNVAL